MQYKSFTVLLSHAYILNPYILEAKLLKTFDYKSPQVANRLFWKHSTQKWRMTRVHMEKKVHFQKVSSVFCSWIKVATKKREGWRCKMLQGKEISYLQWRISRILMGENHRFGFWMTTEVKGLRYTKAKIVHDLRTLSLHDERWVFSTLNSCIIVFIASKTLIQYNLWI